MSMINHPSTGFAIGDPEIPPLAEGALPTRDEVSAALSAMILSASGWRKIFAADGNEESATALVAPADIFLAAAAGAAFARFLKEKTGKRRATVAVGIDTRPTGPALADAMIRTFLSEGLAVRYIFIAAAPEIMAFARRPEEGIDAFAYVSASHNPLGHNGLKFGLADGGVLPGGEARELIERFRLLATENDSISSIHRFVAACPARELAAIYVSTTAEKRRAISAYTLFARQVVTGLSEESAQDAFFDVLGRSLKKRPIGILAELNGSARSVSIDVDFLSGAGFTVERLNDRPRQFAHRIVPEGNSLDLCRRVLEKLHDDQDAFVLGYVPDCDGDRGNLVYYDEARDVMRVPEAQDVFALAVLAELACLVYAGVLSYDGGPAPRAAVVVNDPTSLRIDSIAAVFGAVVFRAEVGEANVVARAREAREEGYLVRILGEGSNGGNITHPSAVRDPISTVFSLAKLYALRGAGGKSGPFAIWCERSGRREAYREDFGFADIAATLPKFTTTSAYESEAAMKIATTDQAELKRRYEAIFRREWKECAGEMNSRFGITDWKAFAYNGTVEREIREDFGSSGKGGLKILFLGGEGRPKGWIWMRGSGTEPVFRIMAEIEGDDVPGEKWLLSFQARLIREADRP